MKKLLSLVLALSMACSAFAPAVYPADEAAPAETSAVVSLAAQEPEAPAAEPTETPAETEEPAAEPTEAPAETEEPTAEPTETPDAEPPAQQASEPARNAAADESILMYYDAEMDVYYGKLPLEAPEGGWVQVAEEYLSWTVDNDTNNYRQKILLYMQGAYWLFVNAGCADGRRQHRDRVSDRL